MMEMSELQGDSLRCYWCKKVIEDEDDMEVQPVLAGFLEGSIERVPFHRPCWEKYYKEWADRVRRDKRRERILIATICATLVGIPLIYILFFL